MCVPYYKGGSQVDAVECLKLLDAAGFDVVNHQSKVGRCSLNRGDVC
jgi:hypothetical protein